MISKTYSSGDLQNKNVFWPAPPEDSEDGTPSAHQDTVFDAKVRTRVKVPTKARDVKASGLGIKGSVISTMKAKPSTMDGTKASQKPYAIPLTTRFTRLAHVNPSDIEHSRGFQCEIRQPLSSQNKTNVSDQTSKIVDSNRLVTLPTAKGNWYVPNSLEEVLTLLDTHSTCRLVAGNAASSWVRLFNQAADTKFISIKHVPMLSGKPVFCFENEDRVIFPSCTTLSKFLEFFEGLLAKKMYDVQSIVDHIKSIANIQVRNLGTIAGNIIAAQSRSGTLHSDIGLILGSMKGYISIQAKEEPEFTISIVDFLTKPDGGIPCEYKNKWVCTKITAVLPAFGKNTVRLARTSCRAYGNFPTLCSTAYSSYDCTTNIHFTGPHGVLHCVVPVEHICSPMESLKSVAYFLEKTLLDITPVEKRLVVQMTARVLCIDGKYDQMASSQTKERRSQGQSGVQAFFVDPTQAPVTEPMIKESSYEHYTGKAMYTQDTLPQMGTLNASPVVMPAAVVKFDPWLLKKAAENLLTSVDSKGKLLHSPILTFMLALHSTHFYFFCSKCLC